MAVRELLSVAKVFHNALELAQRGGDLSNDASLSYGFNGQVSLPFL